MVRLMLLDHPAELLVNRLHDAKAAIAFERILQNFLERLLLNGGRHRQWAAEHRVHKILIHLFRIA